MGSAASVERQEYEKTIAEQVVNADTDAEKLALFEKIKELTVAGLAKRSPQVGASPRVGTSPYESRAVYGGPPATSLEELFSRFVPNGLMDGKTWMKFCADCDLIKKKTYSRQDADMTFVTVNKKEKKMAYQQFSQCLEDVAKRRGMSMDDVGKLCLASGGPQTSGTIADKVALADDKSKFTGTAKKGGPTTVDDGGITLDAQLDRTDADVRGVKL